MPQALSHAMPPTPPPTSEAEVARVAIVASDANDSATMMHLVEALGHTAVAVTDASEWLQSDSPLGRGPGAVAPLAVIVCHRRGHGALQPLVLSASGAGARVLAFTDGAGDESLVVAALEAGARQVFPLDESERVLAARLGAALRPLATQGVALLSVDPFEFDLARRNARLDGTELDLSPREFDLAYYLFDHRNRLITNAELLTSVWSLPQGIDSRRIDTAVCRVRRKMRLGADSGWVLRRFRREGYGLYRDSRDGARAMPEALPAGAERRGNDAPGDEEE